jgi:hypothetical protein
MKPTIITGAVLILIGVLALAYQGFTYTKREKVLEIGPLQATTETEKTIPVPPLVGGLAIVSGVALVAFGALK